MARRAIGKGGGVNSVVMATLATLRRNVKGEKFLPAFNPEARDGFVRRITGEVAKTFDALRMDATVIEDPNDSNFIYICDAAQIDGVVPDFPLPAEARVGVVLEGRPENAMTHVRAGSGLAVTCGVEDHIRMQCLAPGLDPEAVWARLDKLDTAFNGRVEYAFRRDIGYLTANPELAGNALDFAAYVLPLGLELQDASEETMRDMRRLGCVFEPTCSIAQGFSGLCMVSFDCGGSRSEDQCAAAFRRAIVELAERELDARAELAEEGEAFLLDAFSRDLAILRNAYAIAADESISKLWSVRVGIDMGYVSGIKAQQVEQAICAMKSPGIALGATENPKECWEMLNSLYDTDADTREETEDYIDTLRASYLRWALRGVKIIQ